MRHGTKDGHIRALINHPPVARPSRGTQMPANGRCGSPWIMNNDAGSSSRYRGIEQCPIAEIKGSQALASQMPTGAGALVSTLTRPGGIALIPKPDFCCLLLAVRWRAFEMLIEKIEQKLVGF